MIAVVGEMDRFSDFTVHGDSEEIISALTTEERRWATGILKEFIVKGFTLDDERLKEGTVVFDRVYFDEMLDRIHSIRANDRRIWQKITDIFAECSADYDKDSSVTRRFYSEVRNRFYHDITGGPDSGNGLNEEQVKDIELAVLGFYDYIEGLLERGIPFTMEEFAASVNEFLEFRRYEILEGKGSISKEVAERKATTEYELFKQTQKYVSDFDKSVKRLESSEGDSDE